MKIIDLSMTLSPVGPEHDQPKIAYTDHKKGAFLLGLAGLLYNEYPNPQISQIGTDY